LVEEAGRLLHRGHVPLELRGIAAPAALAPVTNDVEQRLALDARRRRGGRREFDRRARDRTAEESEESTEEHHDGGRALCGEGAQGGRAAAATLGEFRQVAPPVQSFASGRRR
jgi:hypothetical protein